MSAPRTPRLSFDQRESRIIEAAAILFSEKGFNGTTTKAIAEKAGINEALLFRHYDSKKELYTALLKMKVEHWNATIIPNLKKTFAKPLSEGLEIIAHTLIKENRRDCCPLRMLLYASLENHGFGQEFFKQDLPLMVFLEEFFKHKIKSKEVSPQEPKELARYFTSFIHQYILMSEIFKAPRFFGPSEKKVIKNFIAFFTHKALQ